MGFIQKNIMLLLGIILGGVVFGGGVYAATVAASSVSYDNSSSKLSSTNVQGAIDGLYTDVDTMKGAYYRTQCISSSSISYNISNSYGAITVYLKYASSCSNYGTLCANTAYVANGANASSTAGSSCSSTCQSYLKYCCSSKCGSSTNTCYTDCYQ